MNFRRLLPLINVLALVVVCALHLVNHGGLRGDFDLNSAGTDAPTEPGEKGRVLFNRWQFSAEQETGVTKAFLLANAPSFMTAKIALQACSQLIGELRSGYPWGVSYSSYIFTLGIALSMVQWVAVGWLVDLQLRRYAKPSQEWSPPTDPHALR